MVPEDEKTRRFLALEELQSSVQARICQAYVGRQLSVLVEKPSSRSEHDMMGHSTCHKVVNFKAEQAKPGDIVNVQITQAKPNSLYGVRLN